MPTLELKNVSYTYGRGTPFEKKALQDVSFSFESGVITGLMGHTGSGKSTLVQLLNGLYKPQTGEILLDGKNLWDDPKKMSEIRFQIGLVFQYPEYQLFEETVYKDIAYGPKNMQLPDDEIDRRIRSAIAFCGLGEEYLDKSPFELSGGQKRRVAIAGVMAMEPQVLIFDEPAAGLDPVGREEILGGIRSYQRRTKSTVIIVSHSMEDMAVFADKLVVMSKGKLFMSGSVGEVFRHAEELKNIGLDIPQITKLINILRENGVDISDEIFTVEDARSELVKLFSGKKTK